MRTLLDVVADYSIRLEGMVRKDMFPTQVWELNRKRDRINRLLKSLRERKRQRHEQFSSDRGE